MIRVAAAAYGCERLPDWAALEAKLDDWVSRAGADLLVFPEYAGLETALVGNAHGLTPEGWCARAAERAEEWAALHVRLARKHGVHILAGSAPVREGERFVNRAWLCAPDGAVGVQDKIIPTPYERTDMAVVGGSGLNLFETALGRIGVLICYDSEFPLLGRALADHDGG